MTSMPLLTQTVTAERLLFAAAGPWTAAHAERLEQLVEEAARAGSRATAITIDMTAVDELDTVGAWLLKRLSRHPDPGGKEARFTGVKPRHRGLIDDMNRVSAQQRASQKDP